MLHTDRHAPLFFCWCMPVISTHNPCPSSWQNQQADWQVPAHRYSPGWKRYLTAWKGPLQVRGVFTSWALNPYVALLVGRLRRKVLRRRLRVLVLYATVSGTAKHFAMQVRLCL